MKRGFLVLTVSAFLCLTLTSVFAQQKKLQLSFSKVSWNGYDFPVYLGGKNILGNADGSVEYTITERTDARAQATLKKLMSYCNKSFIVKKMGGNRISLKAPFGRASEMKEIYVSASGEKETGKGAMIVIKREGKTIKVYMYPINDSEIIQPLLN